MSEITGYINMPFHGESAYDIAVRYGYTGTEKEWIEKMGSVTEEEMAEVMAKFANRLCGYVWYADSDRVVDKNGNVQGKLSDCMNENFVGSWFYVRTESSEAGVTSYSDKYKIDGANGYLSLRDYVVWTGVHLVHIPTFEAKASDKKNSDGKYSPKNGVDGLMSSTDKAYLSDLLAHWGKRYIPVYNSPTEVNPGWTSGNLVNWCRETGWYLGGFGKDCGGHPPVVNDNHTSWILLVLAGEVKEDVFPHALQVAFDISNNLIYMRKGWLDGNSAVSSWAETWTKIGDVPDGSITAEKISEDLATLIENLSENSRLLVINDDMAVNEVVRKTLNTGINEVIINTWNMVYLTLPADVWQYWSCIINTAPIDLSDGIYICDSEGKQLFMNAYEFSLGKMYRLIFANGEWNMYEIDPISLAIIE